MITQSQERVCGQRGSSATQLAADRLVTVQRVAHGTETGYAFVLGSDWITVSAHEGHALLAVAMKMSDQERLVFLRGIALGLLVGKVSVDS